YASMSIPFFEEVERIVAGVGEAGIPASNLLRRLVVRLCGVAHSSRGRFMTGFRSRSTLWGTAAVVPRTRCHTVDPPRPRADFMKRGVESSALSRFVVLRSLIY